jgi:hypothetical protein
MILQGTDCIPLPIVRMDEHVLLISRVSRRRSQAEKSTCADEMQGVATGYRYADSPHTPDLRS